MGDIVLPRELLVKLLDVAEATALTLEADKHLDQPKLVEVQLLRQVEKIRRKLSPPVKGRKRPEMAMHYAPQLEHGSLPLCKTGGALRLTTRQEWTTCRRCLHLLRAQKEAGGGE